MICFVFLLAFTSSIHVATCSESSKLVIGQVGDTVTLPCKYDTTAYGLLSICWGRHQSWIDCENTVISTDGLNVNYRESLRFNLTGDLERGDVSLTIRAARKSDAGMYVCRIAIPGLFNDISHNVYLFISNGVDAKRVVSETQLTPTMTKQEKQVFYDSYSGTFTTELNLVSEQTTADTGISDVYVGESVAVAPTEETMKTFIMNTVRVGAIIFIPGLIIALLFRLRRSRGRTSTGTA